MGKLKDRVTTTISADLIPWHRNDELAFTGIIHNSIDKELDEGTLSRMRFMEVFYYPQLNDHWDAHFIGRTLEGKYIRMEIKHQMRTKGPEA